MLNSRQNEGRRCKCSGLWVRTPRGCTERGSGVADLCRRWKVTWVSLLLSGCFRAAARHFCWFSSCVRFQVDSSANSVLSLGLHVRWDDQSFTRAATWLRDVTCWPSFITCDTSSWVTLTRPCLQSDSSLCSDWSTPANRLSPYTFTGTSLGVSGLQINISGNLSKLNTIKWLTADVLFHSVHTERSDPSTPTSSLIQTLFQLPHCGL